MGLVSKITRMTHNSADPQENASLERLYVIIAYNAWNTSITSGKMQIKILTNIYWTAIMFQSLH